MSKPLEIQDICFFFGAGASAPFGIPTMVEMTSKFEDELKKQEPRLFAPYSSIRRTLLTALGEKNVDVEAIFSVVHGLQASQSDGVDDLSTFAIQKFAGGNFESIRERIRYELKDEDLRALEMRFQSFVRRACRVNDENRERLDKVYNNFFRTVGASFSSYNSWKDDFRFGGGWTIFTTNYDTCVEEYFREFLGYPLDLGFGHEGVLDLRRAFAHNGHIQLLKLHGSTSWHRRVKDGAIVEKEYDLDLAAQLGKAGRFSGDVVVFPISHKRLYLPPYIGMYSRLHQELAARRRWVVVGYSFRDPVIRDVFLENATPEKRLIMVHPEPSFVRNRLPGLRAEWVPVARPFGEQDYGDTNQEIANAIASG